MEVPVKPPFLVKTPDEYVIAIIEEISGKRSLNIKLSDVSLHLIVWEIEKTNNRPAIFEFTGELANALNADIDRVVIHDIDERGVYISSVFIVNPKGQEIALNLHVTTALTLAISVECPIFVTEEVFNKSAEELDRNRETQIQRIFDSIDTDRLTRH